MSLNHRLGKALADTYALALKTQNYHWNVEGASFVGLHSLFEQQYTELQQAADAIAERIRSLGEYAPGGLREFANLTSIADARGQMTAAVMVADLAAGHQAMAAELAGAIREAAEAGDEVSADLLTGRSAVHQKAAWMLRSLAA